MPRDFRLYLRDILKALERINLVLERMDKAAFKRNDVGVDAILFNLMTIGEAVKNIPDEIRVLHPEIKWN